MTPADGLLKGKSSGRQKVSRSLANAAWDNFTQITYAGKKDPISYAFIQEKEMSKKARKNKMDPRKVFAEGQKKEKKDTDWTFDDIVRSKTRHR